jgi:5S rRNA maturation endonuclease (ribonuclease M5)
MIDKSIFKNDRDVLEKVLIYHGATKGYKNWNCIPSRHKNPKNNLTVSYKSGNWVCCCSCGLQGDVFSAIGVVEGITDFKEQLKRVAEISGYLDTIHAPTPKVPVVLLNWETPKRTYDFTDIADMLHFNVSNTQYFINRGLTFTIDKYNLGYHQQGLNYLIKSSNALLEKPNELYEAYQYFIPCYDENGICTNILTRINNKKILPYWVKEKPHKNHNLKGYGASIFNVRCLYEAVDIVFIVEGWADALSIEECEYSAIATNSTGNINLLLKSIKKNKDALSQKIFILAGDSDTAGQAMNNKLEQGLKLLNIKNYTYIIPQQYKDINDFLVSNRVQLKLSLDNFINNLIGRLESR